MVEDALAKNVKECPFCHGAVHRYEHMFQCEGCKAVGDLVTGIMTETIGVREYKPRCKACYECPMGVVGCEWDDKPHGHGCAQTCTECGVTYYHVHPHSNVCSRGTPVTNDVKHHYSHMKHQLKWKAVEKVKTLYCDHCGEDTEHKLGEDMICYVCQKCKIPPE